MAIFLDALPPADNDRSDNDNGGAAANSENIGGNANGASSGTQQIQTRASVTDSCSHSSQMEKNCAIQNVRIFREFCGKIVNHVNVQTLIIILIVINAIMMGVGTFDFVTDDPEIEHAFELTDNVFLVTFTVEAGLQLIYHGFSMFKDGWLVFDFIIIVLSWSLRFLQIIRAFRVFRALRIITRIEIMRNLVAALFDIMPRLAAITALLMLIFYIFAVLCTQLFGELELSGNYFNSLHDSLFTLFVMMTMEWADVARECMAQIWWAWVPFVAFIMITGFIVFNLIIAVVCDAVAVIESKDDFSPDLFGSNFDDSNGDMDMDMDMSEGEAESLRMEAEMEERTDDLSMRLDSMMDSQKEMQATLELLSEELYQSALASLKEEKEEAQASGVSRRTSKR